MSLARVLPPQTLSAQKVAVGTSDVWLGIDAALKPTIGSRGVAALFARSLHLAAVTHPWLAGARPSSDTLLDTAPLKSLLAQQSDEDAVAGANTVLRTFQDLLAGLVGPSLTDRLLRSVWASFAGAQPTQDSSP